MRTEADDFCNKDSESHGAGVRNQSRVHHAPWSRVLHDALIDHFSGSSDVRLREGATNVE